MARSVLAVILGYPTFGITAGLLFGISGRDAAPDMAYDDSLPAW